MRCICGSLVNINFVHVAVYVRGALVRIQRFVADRDDIRRKICSRSFLAPSNPGSERCFCVNILSGGFLLLIMPKLRCCDLPRAVALPATAVMPRTSSSSGLASARSSAKASSWPGSVSMMILRGAVSVL